MKTILNTVKTILFIIILAPQSIAQQLSSTQTSVSELFQLSSDFLADYYSLSRFYKIKNSPERRKRFVLMFIAPAVTYLLWCFGVFKIESRA